MIGEEATGGWTQRALQLLAGDAPSWVAARPRPEMPRPLLGAIEQFTAVQSPAGEAATGWLREHALEQTSARTWLYLGGGRVLGFCALASGQVALTRRQREEVGSGYRLTPATLVAWLAKDHRADLRGVVLLRHADAIARRVALLQGNAVLALDAFDDDVERLWRQRYGFRAAAPPLEHESAPARRRLWLPLDAVSDQ